MPTYWNLLQLIFPVFALVAIGALVRRVHWIEGPAETSLIRLVVNLCYPCFIFDAVIGNTALHQPGNVLLPPLLGFGTTAFGIGLSLYAGRALRLMTGQGLRTFALSTGIGNYGYLPLPIVAAMWGHESQGVLLVHNLGAEVALWTVGLLVMSGSSLREGWRKLLNPVIVTLVVALAINFAGLAAYVPPLVRTVAHDLGVCAIPIGLLMIGVSLAGYLAEPRNLFPPRIALGSCALRLGLMPVAILCVAYWVPCPVELKRVLVVQAAMPAAVFPIVLARHYGGQPLVAVQVVLATTALGLLVIPLWLSLGLAWIF
jgi:predicted permease